MALIQTPDQRLAKKSAIKGVISGPSGIGKTSLARTLDPATTLILDFEAGMLALEDWGGDSIDVRAQSRELGISAWDFARAISCVISGPDPSNTEEQVYSQKHYDFCCELLGGAEQFDKYETIFIDSITVAGRLCFAWAQKQPAAFSEKTGKPDTRGAYGLHGQEMIRWLTHWQHTPEKNVWLVGILDKKTDDYNRTFYTFQIEGGKTGLELPGIVDEVLTMTEIQAEDGSKFRAFVCHTLNPWGYPAKDRSGRLDQVEEPHLGKLMAKIKGTARHDAMATEIPAQAD